MKPSLFLYNLSDWERWDWRLKYIPLVPLWLWCCLRARSWWWFTPSNPKLQFGGFEGAAKSSIYSHLPSHCYPATLQIAAGLPFAHAEALVSAKFSYPFAVKPEVGRMGYMFRIVHTTAEFRAYHEAMKTEYLVQDFIGYPLEVSVFYHRFPGAKRGNISAFVSKQFVQICGDGKSTVEKLMQNHSLASMRLSEWSNRYRNRLHEILKPGEILHLSEALNLSRGCRLISLEDEIDEKLLFVIDEIATFSGQLFYGRFDIKCATVQDLKAGKNFSVIEYNGCGAEPHHVYGNGNSLWQACRILAKHWLILSRISRENRRRGVGYLSFPAGWKLMRKCRAHFAELRQLDKNFPEF